MKRLITTIVLGAGFIPGNCGIALADDSVETCKRLAASPTEPGSGGVGVASWLVKPAQAIPACEAALKVEPDSAIIHYRLGRALDADKRYTEALEHYQIAAQKGFVEAAVNIAGNYRYRWDPPDFVQVAIWLKRAADGGHVGSQFALGDAYWKGEGVPQSTSEALKWFRQAADGKDSAALFMLGQFHDTGEGVTHDQKIAFDYYMRAARLNHPLAMYNVASMYARGEGVALDAKEAARWFALAKTIGAVHGTARRARRERTRR